MIDEEKYMEVLNSGLLLDHYFVLCKIHNRTQVGTNTRIQGFLNLLTKKDYLSEDGTLTSKGLKLIEGCNFVPQEVEKQEVDTITKFETWVDQTHQKCQQKIYDLTGKMQVRSSIKGKYYSFLPNKTDFRKAMYSAVRQYKLKDFDKIEKVLLTYIISCQKSGQWYPLLQYYIIKDGTSRMVTDIESDESATMTTTHGETSDKRVDPDELF